MGQSGMSVPLSSCAMETKHCVTCARVLKEGIHPHPPPSAPYQAALPFPCVRPGRVPRRQTLRTARPPPPPAPYRPAPRLRWPEQRVARACACACRGGKTG